MDIQNLRKDFDKNENCPQIDKNPIHQFKQWLQEAISSKIQEPTAFSLSTATVGGIPSSRILLLKEIIDTDFVFYTNYESQKGRELSENPNAAMLFFWANLERQVRIVGKVEKISSSKSDEYFNIRPRENKISAIVSNQSKKIEDRAILIEKCESLKNNQIELKRPDNWGGYYLSPTKIEFWQGGKNRLHHRYLFERGTNPIEWEISILSP